MTRTGGDILSEEIDPLPFYNSRIVPEYPLLADNSMSRRAASGQKQPLIRERVRPKAAGG